jgi:O-Antigen ligase
LPTAPSTSKPSQQFWILALFLLILFATGGASRADVQSLVILRPVTLVICALACMTLRRDHLAGRGWLLGWSGVIFTLALLHLVPLPPSLWHSLPGRQDLLDVEQLSGLPDSWRPLTLAPLRSWQALTSLLTPFAVILLGIQLNRHELFRLLPLVIALATLSGLIGLLQVIGDAQGPLYFYEVTNKGWSVGLFANRNHAATLLACLFPMLAVYASLVNGKLKSVHISQMIAAAVAILLVPLILVAGSRSGLVSAVIGLGAAALLYRQRSNVRMVTRSKPERLKGLPAIGGSVVVVSLAFLTYFLSRAEAIERLLNLEAAEDERGDFWVISVDLFWKYFPWSSGSGSFVEAYQNAEPTRLLDATYLNRAHNDWAETAVTFGLPGIVILLAVGIAFGIRSYRLWRSQDESKQAVVYGRLASVMIAMIAIASTSDYPLRTPTMMGLFAIFALWFTEADID